MRLIGCVLTNGYDAKGGLVNQLLPILTTPNLPSHYVNIVILQVIVSASETAYTHLISRDDLI
jgi:hypothetical protein